MHAHKGRTWLTCGGALLLVLGCFGAYYGWQTSRAYWLYERTKYGTGSEDLTRSWRAIEKAHRLYPYNYRFCVWVAEQAYRERDAADEAERARRLHVARSWTMVGLSLNRYNASLQLLHARLLALSDPRAAATAWARYVEWYFWEPYNHAVLVELYAAAGNFEKAAASLEWIKGTPSYANAEAALQKAWQREMAPPVSGNSSGGNGS